jgi:hypothetical protein
MSFQFYTLPQNTSGAAVIPISNMPIPLAGLTAVTDTGDTLAVIRVSVGWRAQSSLTHVLFKLWRGAPGTGELVCSVQDSAEGFRDFAGTTDFSQVVTGLPAGQPTSFILTAETTDAGALAQAIGPLTFTAYGANLSVQSYFEFINNTFGGANIPVAQTPVPLAYLTVQVQPGQRVILRPAVCWIIPSTSVSQPRVSLLFKLWRGAPGTGVLVASATDSADVERSAVTSFSHVDSGFAAAQAVTYVLTAEVPVAGYTASIAGALTFTVALASEVASYTLPQNTSGSVGIPVAAAGTPLASLTLPVTTGSIISLRAAAGWMVAASSSQVAPILFKIWRGAPTTGTLIYSTLDSGEASYDNNKVTALAHIDRGFTAAGQVTYTLTAELPDPASAVSIIGPLTFTALPQ